MVSTLHTQLYSGCTVMCGPCTDGAYNLARKINIHEVIKGSQSVGKRSAKVYENAHQKGYKPRESVKFPKAACLTFLLLLQLVKACTQVTTFPKFIL